MEKNIMKTKCVHIQKSLIDETLKTAPVKGKKELEPLKSFSKLHGAPLNILEDHEITTNGAEQHMRMGDLWHCLEGEAVFICGGELVSPRAKVFSDGSRDENEWRSDAISNGATIILRPGDWLWIPAGEPHQHQAEKTARLVIIKIPQSA